MIMPEQIPERAMIKPSEISKLFSVTRALVYHWIAHGKINYIKISGTVRIPRDDLIEFIERSGAGFVNLDKRQVTNRLVTAMRGRINKIIRSGNIKSSTSMKLLGCTREQFLIHIEQRFKQGMTWENYGKNGWTIDHIIPCSKFDLSRTDHQKMCFHYSNLQPMWFVENIKKGTKLTHRSVDAFLKNLHSIS